jgi:serine protease inhibitor ecotin
MNERFPPDLFEDHSVTVVLKDRVLRRLQGKIYINIYDDDRVEVSYVETTSRGTVKPRGTK